MSLHDAFIDELRDTYDAEKQLIKALPKMAKAATWHPLRAAFQRHLEETRLQAQRLEEVFESIGEKARGKHCDGMAGIIEEGKTAMEEDFDESTMDAVLVAAAQRAEHYEMAAYGTLVAWAKAMGHEEAARLLEQSLEEEKATDEKLTQIAESGINREAARAAQSREEGASTRRGGRKAGGRKAAGRKTAPRKGGAKKGGGKKGGRKAAKRGGKKAAKGRR